MRNIRFRYLYRDGANYKRWGEIVFSNGEDLQIDAVSNLLTSAFLPDGLFIADQIRVPEVFLTEEYPLTTNDHCFHEFYLVEGTSELPTDQHRRSIQEFLSEISREAVRGWRALDWAGWHPSPPAA